jgi:hypothetical protein
MSNQYLKLRRSNVQGRIPTTESIDFGEIALNTFDGKAYMKVSGSDGIKVVPIGSNSGSFSGSFTGTFSGSFSGSGANLSGIPASGIVGLNLSQISSGSYSASISENGLLVNTRVVADSFTGSLFGTASWARNALTASYVRNAISASHAETASYVRNAQTASYVLNAVSASHAESASYAVNATNAINAATASNILGGKAPHVPYFITDTTLATSSIYQSGSTSVIINQDANTTSNPEALYVWQPHPTSINVISGKGNVDDYLQLNIQNTNQGGDASSDVVATANNGNETTNYIDMGVNSENYNGFLGGPNDAYVYSAGENLWIGNYSDGKSVYFFNSSSEASLITLTPANTVDVNTTLNAPDITGSLHGTASWAKNVISASHAVNSDFAGYAQTAGIAANGGVTQIIAGSGVSLIPSTGVGNVTVIATGVGGVTILSGSNVTQSFSNSNTWNFTHNLGVRTPIISVFDSNYNQVIPQGIQLIDTASAIITFPTLESGFAIASVGGVTGNALSSSYSLFATYADTASYYAETDPVFVAKSASLATTGSNTFRGTQIVTGSLFTSGSNTLIGNTILSGSIGISGSSTIQGTTIMSGSLSISGSTTQTGNNTLIGTTTLTGSIFINGDIIPEVSSSFDLGSLTNPWRSIYVQSGSISIQSDILGGIPATISNANGNVTFAGAGFQLKSGSFVPFEVNSSARTVIRVPNLPAGDIGGFSIIGSSTGAYQPVTNAGGLLHLTGNDEQSARLTVDAFGSGSFVSYVSRKARGTAASPLPVQAGDVMLRMATAGWTGTGYGISTPGVAAATTFEIVALDNFTTSSIGSRMHFYNAPSGSVTRTLSATIDTTGITIPSSSRLFGTASWAINAQTASYVLNAISSSFATTASYILNAISSSFSQNAVSSSFAQNSISSSFTQNARTASYVLNAVSSSFATTASTASYVLNAVSSSFAQNSQNATTASYVLNAVTASYVLNAISSSFSTNAQNAISSSFATNATNATTASYVLNAVSSSFATNATTASYVLNAVSSSFASTASFVRNAQTASYINPLNQNVIITGSLRVSGSLTEIGDTVITGSLTLSSGSALRINNGFYVDGQKQFNYGQFSSTQTQSGSADTAYSATFNTTDFAQGVSLVSQSRITVANTGIYNIQFSSQLHTTANQAVDFSIWFAMTGSNIANSNTDFTVEKIAGGGYMVVALNFLTQIASGSYVELKYSKTTTQGQLQAKGTQSTPTRPATPSVILTVTQIA